MVDLIEFGKIVNTHGLKGELKVYSYTDNNEKILKLKNVYIDNVKYEVQSMKLFKNMFLLKIKGIDQIEAAEKLLNKMCLREVIPGESNDEQGYFIRDLIGLEVVDLAGAVIGNIKEVFSTGANDVYEVLKQDGSLIYLPAIKSVIKKIDIKAGKVHIELMEGLE